MIGVREISEYAQKYNMKFDKDTPLSMEWCFNMADKAYEKGRADAISEISREMRVLYGNDYEKQIRAEAIDDAIRKLAESEDTMLSDRQYYTLMELKEK